MIKINKKEQEAIHRYAVQVLELCSADMDSKEVLCRAYGELMNTDSEFRQEMFLEGLLEQMGKFQAYYKLSLSEWNREEPGFSEAVYVAHLIEEESPEEQGHTLHNLLEGAKLLETEDLNGITPYTEAASSAARENLRKKIVQHLSQNPAQKKVSCKGSQLFAELNGKLSQDLFIGLTSLILYTMIKKGEIEDCPRDVTLEMIVTTVCENTYLRRIWYDLNLPRLTEKEALRRQQAVRKVSRGLLLAAGFAGVIFTGLFLGSHACALAAVKGASRVGKNMTEPVGDLLADLADASKENLSAVQLPYSYEALSKTAERYSDSWKIDEFAEENAEGQKKQTQTKKLEENEELELQ